MKKEIKSISGKPEPEETYKTFKKNRPTSKEVFENWREYREVKITPTK